MIIGYNAMSANALLQLNKNSNAMQSSLQKLSSGKRINSAADDAAGMAISEKMKNQISGLDQASRNAQDGISLIQTAEGSLNETNSMLSRMRDLAVQASNDGLSSTDRQSLQKEVDQLAQQITRVSNQTNFNGIHVLDGQGGASLNFQIGANGGETMNVKISAMDAHTLGVDNGLGTAATAAGGDATATAGIDISSSSGAASNAIATIDTAIKTVSIQQSALGAYSSSLQHTINYLQTQSENLSEANSRIEDVDMAKEMSNFTKQQVLTQAATSMLAQANQQPQSVLKLLG